MDLVSLSVLKREKSGKGGASRVRREGFVPAVLYGPGGDPVNLKIEVRDLYQVLHGEQGEHAIVELQITDAPDLNCPAMFKEVQHDPVRGDVVHADLLRIDLKKKIHTVVPTRLEGRAKGVTEGGVLDHQTREVEVECLPVNVPEYLAVDISQLDIGDSLHVSDLQIPAGVDLLTSPERALVAIRAPRLAKKEEEEAAALEGAEVPEVGEAAEEGAAEGEAGGEEGGGE